MYGVTIHLTGIRPVKVSGAGVSTKHHEKHTEVLFVNVHMDIGVDIQLLVGN